MAFELHEKRGGIYGNDLQIFGTHGHDRYSAGNRSAPVALRQATQSRHDRRSAEQLLALFIAMDLFDLVQWPAMAITVGAAAMVASKRTWKRNEGFWLFVLSNVLWTFWAVHDRAYALVLLQVCLAALNVRGIYNNRSSAPK